MIVHFTSSKTTLVNDIDSLRRITRTIKKRHELARDWVDPVYKRLKKEGSRGDLSKVYHRSMEELAKSDVLIAEVTRSSFGVGYQVALAIQQKKPTLLLSKEGVVNDSLVRGLDAAVVRFCEYNDKNVESLVDKFLSDNDIQAKDLRFNFFIDRQIYNYLRWASYKTGKTKAKILRDLVLKEINKSDS